MPIKTSHNTTPNRYHTLQTMTKEATEKQFVYGEEVVIYYGTYADKGVCRRAWVNAAKTPTQFKTDLLVELVNPVTGDFYMDHKNINNESFMLKKDARPKNVTQMLMEDHPRVRQAMRDAARLVARLGVQDGKDAANMFLLMVNNHIATLKARGPKANYLPIQMDDEIYRALFGKAMEAMQQEFRKRAFEDPNAMSDS